MPTNEEGEFELVLGNRQLLSVFFIVVILLGIFFTMGYIVGQHSTPLVAADSSPKAATKPVVVDPPREPEPQAEPVKPSKSAEEPAKKAEPIHTASQQPAETAKAEPAPKAEPKPAKAERKGGEIVPPTPSAAQPSGTYLQLAATTKREADIMVDVLRQKKFTAIDAEIPEKPGLFRVLVGPISDAQVNKTKTDLQSAGFPGDKSIKRTF